MTVQITVKDFQLLYIKKRNKNRQVVSIKVFHRHLSRPCLLKRGFNSFAKDKS